MQEDEDDRLRRENERLALSLKALGGGVWDYDVDADVLMCSERWYAILGLNPVTDQICSLAQFQDYIHTDDLGIAASVDLAEINLLIERDEPYHREFRIVRRDGSVRHVKSVACLTRDPQTGRHRAVGCMTDVTPTKSFENARAVGGTRAIGEEGVDLSGREQECLLWVSVGKTAWETSVILELSSRTVEFHLAGAVRKLRAANKVHAAVLAIRMGLL